VTTHWKTFSEHEPGVAQLGVRELAVLTLVLAVYLLAINPWFLPEQYDDIVYFFGAREIAAQGAWSFDGARIADWGPGLPLVLALPMVLGVQSVVAAKAIVAIFVALALVLCHRLLTREGRPYPLLATTISGLAPAALLAGSRVMADWPFTAISFAFLLMLGDLAGRRRSLGFAVLAGLVFGYSVITRFVGVLLGVAIAAQALQQWRNVRRLKGVLPEVIAGAIGCGAFVGWRLKTTWEVAHGLAAQRYNQGVGVFSHLDPAGLLVGLSNVLFHTERLASAAGLAGAATTFVAAAISVPILVGLADRYRSRRLSPADWYALATLGVFLTYEVKQSRYLLPVTPFIVSWFLGGIRAVGRAARLQAMAWTAWAARIGLAAWILLLLSLDGYLLIRGNGRTHHGLSFLASPTAEVFYRGYWRDLWDASQAVRRGGAGATSALLGSGDRKYVFAFSGRRCLDWPAKERVDFVLAVDPTRPSDTDRAALGLAEERRYGSVTVFRATR
jgi:hypothetical protein